MSDTETETKSMNSTAKPDEGRSSPPMGLASGGGPAARGLDTSGAPLKATAARVPPRPDKPDTDLSSAFAETRHALDSIMGDQNQRVMELKLSATQSIEQAVTRLEESARHTRALVERNDVLAREAERLAVEGAALETQQDELESKVEKAAERNEALAERANNLRDERVRLQEEREELEEVVQKETDELALARSDVERLTGRKEKLTEENGELERIRGRLEENIARLERLRDEYLSAINRLKNTKDDLLKLPGEDAAKPSAS